MSHDSVHASRREPSQPSGPTHLRELATELLAEAAELDSGRTARTLTPGAGSPLKQTLLALRAGSELQEHVAPGPATLLTVMGTLVLTEGQGRHEVAEGMWMAIPDGPHGLTAETDGVALLTVAPGSP